MVGDPRQVDAPNTGARVSAGELVDRLSRFDGPPEQFLANLLALQCQLAAAAGGAILRPGQSGKAEVVSVFPPPQGDQPPPQWLAQAVEAAGEAANAASVITKPLHGDADMYGQPAQRHLVMLPIRGGAGVRGVAAFVIESSDAQSLAVRRERLELTSSLLSLYEMRLTLQRRQADFARLRTAMEVLAAVNDHDRFAGAAMSFCNEVAARWKADRVSMGFLKGRYVHMKSLSHTEKFSRKMKLVQDIEATMEECLDQDVETIHPCGADATYVSRSASELSTRHGHTTVLSLPLRREGQPIGVVTIERPSDQSFAPEEIEAARLTCDLCTARMADLHRSDRWFGARAAGAVGRGFGAVLGPRHTWAKVTVILITTAIVLLTFARGDWQADGSFVLEAVNQQTVPAPFEGHVRNVFVQPGAKVVAGETVLATLETTKLDSELSEALADYSRARIARDTAQAESKHSEAKSAKAQMDKAQTRTRELERRIALASMTSPVTGTVISPDISRQGRFHVDLGQAMFEIAPLDQLRAELAVGEDEIADVLDAFERAQKEGRDLTGTLAASSKPAQRIDFVVERINPIAEVLDNRNIFRIRVRLEGPRQSWMRPGMEGVARIHLGRKHYAWLWSRKLVNWVRMKLWI